MHVYAHGHVRVHVPAGGAAQVPIKDCPETGFTHDDLRLAVADDAFNLHVVGQEEAPILAGETAGALDPSGCSWRVGRASKKKGTQMAVNIELTLRKAAGSRWGHQLIKTWYV
eukprot:1788966-Prymnesium_polylepis.1